MHQTTQLLIALVMDVRGFCKGHVGIWSSSDLYSAGERGRGIRQMVEAMARAMNHWWLGGNRPQLISRDAARQGC